MVSEDTLSELLEILASYEPDKKVQVNSLEIFAIVVNPVKEEKAEDLLGVVKEPVATHLRIDQIIAVHHSNLFVAIRELNESEPIVGANEDIQAYITFIDVDPLPGH